MEARNYLQRTIFLSLSLSKQSAFLSSNMEMTFQAVVSTNGEDPFRCPHRRTMWDRHTVTGFAAQCLRVKKTDGFIIF